MPEVDGKKFPYTEEGMADARAAEMETMAVGPEDLKGLADEADAMTDEMLPTLSGDFSLNRINRVVDALNRVVKLFKAPPYPKFESLPETGEYPPEFSKYLMMVGSAVEMSGMDEYDFSINEIKSDEDLLDLAGKLDAIASDRTMKAFLNKPLGTGELQAEMGVANAPDVVGGDIKQPSSATASSELDLFMSRMA